MGDRQLRLMYEAVSEEGCRRVQGTCHQLIAEIQAATAKAHELGSIASRLALTSQARVGLGFFLEHYFGSLRGEQLSHAQPQS